jgi:hypothetical protein
MFRDTDSTLLPFASRGGAPRDRTARHQPAHAIAFDLTIPGLDSSTARDMLEYAFGAGTSAFVVETSRLHDHTKLYVETASADLDEVIGKLTAYFPHAMLGRITRVTTAANA